jgi:hypothetical protein
MSTFLTMLIPINEIGMEVKRSIQNFLVGKNDLKNCRFYGDKGRIKYSMSVKKCGQRLKNARAGHTESHDQLP